MVRPTLRNGTVALLAIAMIGITFLQASSYRQFLVDEAVATQERAMVELEKQIVRIQNFAHATEGFYLGSGGVSAAEFEAFHDRAGADFGEDIVDVGWISLNAGNKDNPSIVKFRDSAAAAIMLSRMPENFQAFAQLLNDEFPARPIVAMNASPVGAGLKTFQYAIPIYGGNNSFLRYGLVFVSVDRTALMAQLSRILNQKIAALDILTGDAATAAAPEQPVEISRTDVTAWTVIRSILVSTGVVAGDQAAAPIMAEATLAESLVRLTILHPDTPFLVYYRDQALLWQVLILAGGLALIAVFTSVDRQRRLALRAKQELEGSVELKSRFLATMSHEMRTPLNGIIGMAEMIGETTLDAEQRKQLRILQNSSFSLLSLINQLLDFSKFEKEGIVLDPVPTDLATLMVDTVNAVNILASHRQIALHLRMPREVPRRVTIDPLRLRQIVTNLLSNAIKFTSHGHVELAVTLDDESGADGARWLRIAVTDTGIGIPADKLDDIFVAFRQADVSTTRKFGGTGLGLSITQKLAESMGGSISVTSTEGEGSVFTVRVPVTPLTYRSPLRRQEGIVAAQNAILICKSEPIRHAVAEVLDDIGALVRIVSSAEDAIAAQSHAIRNRDPFSLLLSDDTAMLEAVKTGTAALVGETDAGMKCIWLRDSIVASAMPTPEQIELANLICDAPFIVETLADKLAGTIAHRFGRQIALGSVNKAETFPGLRVLLVEDSEVNQIYAETLFERLGCEMDIASNGLEGVNLLRQGRAYDIIFLDCQMPVMDGFTAATQMAGDMTAGRIARTPIVALTANAMPGDRERCLTAGMTDYQTKPMRREDITAMIRKHVPRARDIVKFVKATSSITDESAGVVDVDAAIPDDLSNLLATGTDGPATMAGPQVLASVSATNAPFLLVKSLAVTDARPAVPAVSSVTDLPGQLPQGAPAATASLAEPRHERFAGASLNTGADLAPPSETAPIAPLRTDGAAPDARESAQPTPIGEASPVFRRAALHPKGAVLPANSAVPSSPTDTSIEIPAVATKDNETERAASLSMPSGKAAPDAPILPAMTNAPDIMETLREPTAAADSRLTAASRRPSADPVPVLASSAPRSAAAIDGMPDDLPSVDAKQLLATREATGKRFGQLLTLFSKETPGDLARLATAAAARDYETCTRIAHTLKSSAKMLGAPRLSAMAKSCEDMSRSLDADPAGIVALGDMMTAEFATYIGRLRRPAQPA